MTMKMIEYAMCKPADDMTPDGRCAAIGSLRFEVERLRAALVHIECEPINAEFMARAALDWHNEQLAAQTGEL